MMTWDMTTMDNEDNVRQQGERWQLTRILMLASNGRRFHTQQSNERKIEDNDIARGSGGKVFFGTFFFAGRLKKKLRREGKKKN